LWVKLDDHFPEHRKLAELGAYAPLCGWLYICALAWCNRQLTDGRIPFGHLPRLTCFDHISAVAEDVKVETLATMLVNAGLWEKTRDGYQIHDYLEYQYSREEVLKLRALRAESGRLGGQQRWQNARQSAKQDASKVPSKRSSKTVAKVYPVPGTYVPPASPEPPATAVALVDSLPEPLLSFPEASKSSDDRSTVQRTRPPVHALLDHYATRFTALTGQSPAINGGKDGMAFKRLLKNHTEAVVRLALDRFFDEPSRFVEEAGYTIGVFASQFNRLIAADTEHRVTARTKRNIAVVEAFLAKQEKPS
jgi:hypothetical protein